MDFAKYNPHNKPDEQLPAIFGYNAGGEPGWYMGFLLAQDGECMGSHLCSSEGYIPGDLGLLEGRRADRHEGFRTKYPDGYRMVYVPAGEVPTHVGLAKALKRNRELIPASEDAEAVHRG